MAIDRTARWLHLSDLHCPGRDDRAWEEAISSALDRLREVRERWGTIDFVLISGNVARAGRTDEYARATRLVEEVQQRLTRDKDSPVVLAVPGVHDVQGADGDARGVADTGGEQTFANWSAWWESPQEFGVAAETDVLHPRSMSTTLDEHRVPRFPEKISLEALPAHLRNNPIARLHTLLPAGVEEDLIALLEDVSVEEVVQELADAR